MIGSGTNLPKKLMSLLNQKREIKQVLSKVFDENDERKLELQLKDVEKKIRKITGRYNYSVA
ncbi:hypothetical protein K8R61_02055 [bacterium]|nr:hypothetical protein [bacterium]